MQIKTIFFDIGGVLLHIHPERTIHHIASIVNLPEEELKQLFPTETYYRYEKGEVTEEAFYRDVCQKLPVGKTLPKNEFWTAWRKLVGTETGASDVLTTCKKTHPVWLLSNTNARHIENGVGNQFPFFDQVDGAVYSYKVGSRKPEPGIFEQALQMANVPAENALFIDDQEENILKAKSMGFMTIHYKTVEDLKTNMRNLNLLSDEKV